VIRKLLPVAICVVALAACGGSAHGRKGPPPTKAAFAAAANRVCRTTRSHRGRLAGLRKLAGQVPLDEQDLYRRWLGSERLAIAAGDVLTGRKKPGRVDPLVVLAIARGKIAGYAGRLGAVMCVAAPGVTMPS
jgi:hypothetical protein